MPAMHIVEPVDPVIRILIQDIKDAEVVAETRRIVDAVFREQGVTGTWVVAIAASETRGRWDVGIRGPAGQHLFSFLSSPELVPEFVRHYLQRTLRQIRR